MTTQPELPALIAATSTAQLADPAILQRVRWRCRRGLLELDIVLGRFVETYYATLNDAELAVFDQFLDMPDTLFWDRVSGKQNDIPEAQRALLEKIRSV